MSEDCGVRSLSRARPSGASADGPNTPKARLPQDQHVKVGREL